MVLSVPVETLKRLKQEELADAAKMEVAATEAPALEVTLHKPDLFYARADRFQEAIDMETENRKRAASVTLEIETLNKSADKSFDQAINWILSIAGFAVGIGLTAYFLQPGGFVFQWLYSMVAR